MYDKLTNDVYVIAEMSANHAGALENALKIVRMAKEAGADCLKIQTYTPDTMTIPCEKEWFQIHGGLWDGRTLYDLYQEAATPWEWQEAIKEECDRVGIDFLSTPFDPSAVDFLERLQVPFYKVASFELVDIPLIEYVASKGKPVILSCGMGSAEEISEAVAACKRQGNEQIILLKCCSEYPAEYSNMNLATIPDMQDQFGLPVGISDHSLGSLAAVVGVSLGACIVEKHFCLSRAIPSPDAAFSMEPEEMRRMIQDVRLARQIRGEVSYGPTDQEQASLVFRRSIFAVDDIRPGELFTPENIRVIRPGYGAPPKYYAALLGRPANRSYHSGDPIRWNPEGWEEV